MVEANFNVEEAQRMGKSPFKTKNQKAWRNIAVAAFNEGLRQGLYSTLPGPVPEEGVKFGFSVAGLTGEARVTDIGHDELRLDAALNPGSDRRFYGNFFTMRGDAVVIAYMERKTSVTCRFRRSLQ